jgi:hypothetical protein
MECVSNNGIYLFIEVDLSLNQSNFINFNING